jgi:hypothetical protein
MALGTKKIICNKCSREIESKDNLVTTFKFIKIVPYHSKCYSNEIKSLKTLVISNQPINGMASNILTIFITILALILIFLGDKEFMFLLLMPLVRLYSLLMIENRI